MNWKMLFSVVVGIGIGISFLAKGVTAHPDYVVVVDSAKQELNRSAAIQANGRDSLTLPKEKVEDWIRVRIKVARLQHKMKANAEQYENVVESFYGKRKELLISQGWTVADFDEAKERIHAAISAMDMEEELQNSQADHEQEVSEIRQNEFYTASQKEQMIEGLQSIREQKRMQFIEPTKDDWPAVRPYRAVFKEVGSWIAGNRAELPELPELPF